MSPFRIFGLLLLIYLISLLGNNWPICIDIDWPLSRPLLLFFWAAERERKKIQTAIQYGTFEGSFLCFHGQDFFKYFFLNVASSALKSYIKS
jgi:hypothetical protein